ncbi:MAG: DUF2807 domain-containing protein [Patescibacteria group bacterium]
MKKSINITLNGLVFSLEEDAYEKLQAYLDSIKEYYEAPEEGKEILADIESSIAEKFGQKLKSAKQAITLADVAEVIKVMGTVAEITESEETSQPAAVESSRSAPETPLSKKRLYRDPDDVIIAGVASGIAAYFGIDPVFVRLIFIILVFANGLGVLAYLIFWIAMPKAATNAQKLEMRGKPVNLAEIQQAVKEKSKTIGAEGRDALGHLRRNNAVRQILGFPVRVVEALFLFLKNIGRFLLPAISIFLGLVFLAASLFSILGLSIASALMVFNINSPYLVSDLPLAEIASQPGYYVGVISLYAICVLPLIFLSSLGLTMIRRKNSFNLVASSILIGIWMAAIAVFVVAAVDLVPLVKTRVEEINRQQATSQSFAYRDFNKLYLSGYQDIKVVKGDDFAINLSGRPEDLARLSFKIEEGQLQVTQRSRENKGICIFCFDKKISGEIVMPRLDSFVGVNRSEAELKGFDQDIYISLGETAEARLEMQGQNLNGSLSGLGSELRLSGTADSLDLKMDGSAELAADDLTAQKIKLTMSVFSEARLSGSVAALTADLKGHSELFADDLSAGLVKITARDFSSADLWAREALEAETFDNASVTYRGGPQSVLKRSAGHSSIIGWFDEERLDEPESGVDGNEPVTFIIPPQQ